MISNSGSDENGRYSGGVAGDQGGEWQIIAWYNRPWNCILRYPDGTVRAKIADLARRAALNNKIGYDQGQRNTYWQRLQAAGYDPSKINVACEADCSAGVIANVKAVGYLLGLQKLKTIAATYTGNMRSAFAAAGFQVLTSSKYLVSDAYLLEGDILLNDAYHTATNLTDGRYANQEKGADAFTSGSTSVPAFTSGSSANLIGTCSIPAHTFLVGAEHPEIKTIQRLLKARGFKGKDGSALAVDGVLGDNTAYAVASFQKKKGMKNINFGTVAAATWKYLLNED